MTAVTVARADDDAGVARHLKVFVDGEEVARLLPNETATVELAPGQHRFRGAMDWVRSPDLEVEVSESTPVSVEVSLPLVGMWTMVRAAKTVVKIKQTGG